MFVSGNTALIIYNEKKNDITKIVKSLEESGLLVKGITEIIKIETKEQKGGFLGMLLGTLGLVYYGIYFILFQFIYR